MTVTGKTIGENIEGAKVHIPDVIHSLNDPIYGEGATAVLKGNLAPNGCVIKPAAADSACSSIAARPSRSRTTTT